MNRNRGFADVRRWAFFVGIILMISLGLNWFYAKRVMSRAFQNQESAEALILGHKIENLIMGNSHSYQVQAVYLPNGFNYGSFGEGLSGTYYKLKYLLETKKVSVHNVILGFDQMDFSDFYKSFPDRDFFYWHKLINFWELGRASDDMSSNLLKWVRGKYFSFSDRDAVKNTIRYFFPLKKPLPSLSNGNEEKEPEPPANPDSQAIGERELEHIKSQPFLTSKAIWNRNDRYFSMIGKDQFNNKVCIYYLKQILKLCKRQGIAVFLIKYPKAKSFSDRKAQMISSDEFYQNLSQQIKEYEGTYFLLDFKHLYGDENLFIDGHHIKPGLRKSFSEGVYQKIQKILEGPKEDKRKAIPH